MNITHITLSSNANNSSGSIFKSRLSGEALQENLDFILDKTFVCGKWPLRKFAHLFYERKRKMLDDLKSKIKVPKSAAGDITTGALDIFIEGYKNFTIDKIEDWQLSGKGYKKLIALIESQGTSSESRPLSQKLILVQHNVIVETAHKKVVMHGEMKMDKIEREWDEILEGTFITETVTLKKLLQAHLNNNLAKLNELENSSKDLCTTDPVAGRTEAMIFNFEDHSPYTMQPLEKWHLSGIGYDLYNSIKDNWTNQEMVASLF